MKKLVLFLTLIISLSTFWGYSDTVDDHSPYNPSPADSATFVDHSPYNPNPADSVTFVDHSPYYPNPSKSASAYDANVMTEVKFKIVDADGAPVSNLCVNLEYKSGRKGSYTPGDALTKTDGVVTRLAHPNATYTVIVSDRKMLDYEGKSLRNQMRFTVTVKENAKNKYKLVWTKPTPNELDIAAKKKVTLEFLDKNGKPVKDLWVNLIPSDDKSPEPRQIVPGITDKNGRVYWTVPETGSFEMGVLYSKTNDDSNYESQVYTFSVQKLNSKMSFTWNPK